MDDRVNKVELEMTTMRSEYDRKIGGMNKEIEVLKNDESKVGHELNLKEVVDKELSRVSDEIMSIRKQVEECVNVTNAKGHAKLCGRWLCNSFHGDGSVYC